MSKNKVKETLVDIKKVEDLIEEHLKKFNSQEEIYGRMALIGLRSKLREVLKYKE